MMQDTEQTTERETQSGFICFSSATTENGEDPEKAPNVSVIMRIERKPWSGTKGDSRAGRKRCAWAKERR